MARDEARRRRHRSLPVSSFRETTKPPPTRASHPAPAPSGSNPRTARPPPLREAESRSQLGVPLLQPSVGRSLGGGGDQGWAPGGGCCFGWVGTRRGEAWGWWGGGDDLGADCSVGRTGGSQHQAVVRMDSGKVTGLLSIGMSGEPSSRFGLTLESESGHRYQLERCSGSKSSWKKSARTKPCSSSLLYKSSATS